MTPIESDVADYLTWMQVHNYARTTVSCRRRYLAYFTDFASGRGVRAAAELTPDLVAAYQGRLFEYRKVNGSPLAFATQAQRLIPVQQFCGWLRRSGRVPTDPTIDLTPPRPDRRLPETTLTADEVAALLAVPNVARPMGLRDRAVLEVFYSCALRRCELIGLCVGDVDFARGTVFVRHGKGAKDRHVPIGQRALFWLRLYQELARPFLVSGTCSERLFVTSRGTPLCADWLSRKVRRSLINAGLTKHGGCHLLRHSVATLMLEGGADIRYVAELLGHARLETTQRYTRVSIERLRAVHAATHPAAGLDVAMAEEICNIIPDQILLASAVGRL